ncbi:hypothetical protein [Chryseobacterium sp. M5A1_1a]
MNNRSYHHKETDGKLQYTVFHNNTLQNNPPIINDKYFFLFSVTNMKFLSIQDKWKEQYSNDKENTKTIFDKVKKFNINSFRLMDGFRCIIKIPDKLAATLIMF